MMAARPRFDPDSAYIVHQHAAALHYEPLPAATMAQLANLERLMRCPPNLQELEWLEQQRALVLAECPACPPVRHTGQTKRDRNPRHELRYGRRGAGPRHNRSGKAKS